MSGASFMLPPHLPLPKHRVLQLLLLATLFMPTARAQAPHGQGEALRPEQTPQSLAPDAAAHAVLDDATLHREYEAYRASIQGLRLYHVRYIRVPTEAAAQDLISQLLDGAGFEELARRHSMDPGSASRGGDLGVHAGCRWAKSTLRMLDSLGPGQTWPAPVKGTHGWGVYRLESAAPVEPRPFLRYRSELLSGTFQPECPWVPPVTVAPSTAPPVPATVPPAQGLVPTEPLMVPGRP